MNGKSNLQYLKEYSLFESTSKFNEAVSEHLDRCSKELNETDRDVLIMLSRYSIKYDGVAHLKVETISNALNKSKRTVQRAIRKLEKLQIIKRESFIRRITGGNGANVYVFLPSNVMANCHGEESESDATVTTVEDTEITNEPISLKNNLKELSNNVLEPSNNTNVDNFVDKEEYIETSHKRPYRRFKESVMTFIGKSDKSLIYRMYGVYLTQTKALRKAYEDDFLIDIAIRGIHATFHATKRREINNVAGYFNGVFSNMLDDLCTMTMFEFFEYADKYNVDVD